MLPGTNLQIQSPKCPSSGSIYTNLGLRMTYLIRNYGMNIYFAPKQLCYLPEIPSYLYCNSIYDVSNIYFCDHGTAILSDLSTWGIEYKW